MTCDCTTVRPAEACSRAGALTSLCQPSLPPLPLCLPCSAGFAPELFGKPLEEGQVLETDVLDKQGLQYYQWFVKPHHLVSATAEGNRLFILNVNASSVQWRKGAQLLRVVQQSFFVPRAVVKPL